MNQYAGNRPVGGQGAFGGGAARPQERGAGNERASIALDGVRLGGTIAPALFSDIAQEAARSVSAGAQHVNKSSQLRRFYDELVMWQEKVGRDEQRFKDSEPYIRMLKAKAAYAEGRGHVDANFRALFDRLIDEAKDPATLRHAKLFFEAFLAYYKGFRPQ
jgi:CRISPR-associated protein Csm2